MANEYKPVTAQDAIAPFGPLSTDEEATERAKKAGVVSAAYVDYEKALKNYESRSDVETLEQRLARENGGTFAAAKHVREVSESKSVSAAEAAEAREQSAAFKREQASKTNEVA